MTDDHLNGVIEITVRVVTAADDVKAAAKYRQLVRQGQPGDRYLFVEEAGILVHLTGPEAFDSLEDAINEWSRPALRGIAFTSKEVLKKLKRLGFQEKSTAGSHVQLEDEGRKSKVTVPVHGGTLKKGTLKSILRQAGIGLDTFVYA